MEQKEQVNHPEHYGGAANPYEAKKVIRAWKLPFNTGNTLKYICRAGKKNPDKAIEDLEKAVWYLQDEINYLKEEREKERLAQLTIAKQNETFIETINGPDAIEMIKPSDTFDLHRDVSG